MSEEPNVARKQQQSQMPPPEGGGLEVPVAGAAQGVHQNFASGSTKPAPGPLVVAPVRQQAEVLDPLPQEVTGG